MDVKLYFNKWEKLLGNNDWYLNIVPDLAAIRESAKTEKEKVKIKGSIYEFFRKMLNDGKIALGKDVGIWDKERKPIDTIVIHHTEMDPGLTPDMLSAITLIRLYASYYAKPYDEKDKNITSSPISSGHIRNGKQVFWPYHWIVRMDGSVERLLNDNEVGWQAGDWEVNCRSVAIVLDNNFENLKPSSTVLNGVAKIIREQYNFVSKENIKGHREVKKGGTTSCPSNLFLSSGPVGGWKDDVLNLI
jgi:hypothetical protein